MIDEEIYWQDILEAVLAKRPGELKCPFCQDGTILVSKIDRKTLIQCQNKKCGHYIEGRFTAEDLSSDG